MVISGLRDLEKTVARRINMIDLMENKVFGPAILKGEHQGMQKLLSAILKERFGPLPPSFSQKLEDASEKQLMTWPSA